MLTQTHKIKHAAMHVQVSKQIFIYNFFLGCKKHLRIRGSESEEQMVILMQPVDLFMCLSLCCKYRNRVRVPTGDLAPIGFGSLLFYLIFYLMLEPAIRNVSLVPLVCVSLSLFHQARGLQRYLQLCLQTKHEKATSKAAPISTAVGWSRRTKPRRVISSRPSDLACTLERRRRNKGVWREGQTGAPQYPKKCRNTEGERQRKR